MIIFDSSLHKIDLEFRESETRESKRDSEPEQLVEVWTTITIFHRKNSITNEWTTKVVNFSPEVAVNLAKKILEQYEKTFPVTLSDIP